MGLARQHPPFGIANDQKPASLGDRENSPFGTEQMRCPVDRGLQRTEPFPRHGQDQVSVAPRRPRRGGHAMLETCCQPLASSKSGQAAAQVARRRDPGKRPKLPGVATVIRHRDHSTDVHSELTKCGEEGSLAVSTAQRDDPWDPTASLGCGPPAGRTRVHAAAI